MSKERFPSDYGHQGTFDYAHYIDSAAPRRGLFREECQFYHTIDLPKVGLITGDGGGKWDLRPHISDLLKNVPLDGKSILEVGPGSGFLTREMEQRGANVTSVEAPFEHHWDIIPFPGCRERWGRAAQEAWTLCTNSWWFTHEHAQLVAKMIYLSANDVRPEKVGKHDVSLMSNMLLHNRDPLRIITNCADCAEETVVIIEQFNHDLEQIDQPLCRLDPIVNPKPGEENWNVWWRFNKKFFVNFLRIMGFVRFESHDYNVNWGEVPIPTFTLVAHRS
ncbi:class I SAM-dependent methyltransferase [Methylobacterium thuringiense]|uniref:Methyltransferase domain-containing protein n=1 Tax=Methylobacterium thuringiense TaxID=1003091 RepID=A0ABQ4TNE9_9HYPH|nr:methyltransferase domain-containing protein [Methylobacterium thuringiense]GJE55575.1 hypothetical protein EKPJFOCH_2069 [Methylobacterium thuringiense]